MLPVKYFYNSTLKQHVFKTEPWDEEISAQRLNLLWCPVFAISLPDTQEALHTYLSYALPDKCHFQSRHHLRRPFVFTFFSLFFFSAKELESFPCGWKLFFLTWKLQARGPLGKVTREAGRALIWEIVDDLESGLGSPGSCSLGAISPGCSWLCDHLWRFL